MHCFFLVIVLSLHIGYSLRSSDASSSKYESHNLLKLEGNNTSVHRSVRCTPCEQDSNLKGLVSNHLDSEYRGNGADNLGYDWSPMAWGGPAFPRRSKFNMGGMRGRDGRMMMMNGAERNRGNVQVICDTCRAYWNADRRDGNSGRDSGRGRQFDPPEGRNYYASQPGYWEGDKMRLPEDYETRVMSSTVGVLVKPGSRIAYIPTRSGEMFWDGVSGGGIRWDGFSNGISWIGNGNAPDWDRSDSEPRNGPDSPRVGSDYDYRSWDSQKRPNWNDNSGRGYYFTNGVPNDIDPQWRNRGYASNWHYGSTNQNGWNGNNMKWNYGGKQWSDNDRAANRFYFNTPQDRTYGPNVGHHQYGNQYPNYQPATEYPSSFRPHPTWPVGAGYRPNDRFPADFQQGNYGGGDKNRPWDYTSRDPFGYPRPGSRPEWARPGPSYPTPGNNVDNYEKFPSSYGGHDKFSPSDKNDYEKPWNKPSGYGFSKPSGGFSGSFPYGGTHYPEDNEAGKRPNYPSNVDHLFVPNDGNSQLGYPKVGSGENRPAYSSGNRKPSEYPNSGNKIGAYPGELSRPVSADYPGGKRPAVIYTGKRPSGAGGSSGIYPSGGGSSGGYPGSGSLPGVYPSGENLMGGYPSGGGFPLYTGGNRPNGYSGSSNGGSSYPSGITQPGGYFIGHPEGDSRPGSNTGSGIQPNKYYGGEGSSGRYPSDGSFSYPKPSGYPSGGGSPYFSGGARPGFYPEDGYTNSGYIGGSGPTNFPEAGSPGQGYPTANNRPDGYYYDNRPNYSIRRPSSYPESGSMGSKNPAKGYYTGFITEINADDRQSQYGGRYPNYFGSIYSGGKNFYPDKNRDKYHNGGSYFNEHPSVGKNRFPGYSEDRYSGAGSSGDDYPAGSSDRGSDKFYYGQSDGNGKYSGGFPSNNRYPHGGSDEFDRNQSSSDEKNSWNYGQNERKDGIYRRSGGSYPPYRGGQYYTSSYLASMSTTAGSTQAGSDPKTQSVTKADEVTQATSNST